MIRYLHLIWLRHCLRCLLDERIQYQSGGCWVGPRYLENSAALARDLRSRIAVLECDIDPDDYQRSVIAEHASMQVRRDRG